MSASIPDLSFPEIRLGKVATPRGLEILLYPALHALDIRGATKSVEEGSCGDPVLERLPLLSLLHRVLSAKLAGGYATSSIKQAIARLRRFVVHVDKFGLPLDGASVEKSFLHWADHLVHRHRTLKDITEDSAYQAAGMVAGLIDEVLSRSSPLITLTRLNGKGVGQAAIGVQAEKQSLSETFAFGHFLKDVCDGLSQEVVLKGNLPIAIEIRAGGRIEHWSRWHKRTFAEAFQRYQAEGTLQTRAPLANLRIEAEVLMFIGQTGMNCAQALKLKLQRFQYVSHIDGYQVMEYKGRRKGVVIFEIYKEYRPHFERYLDWRARLFPESDLLFPFIHTFGAVDANDRKWKLRAECAKVGVAFVSPRALRNTRVNWLLRTSANPTLTAEMAQHTKETLLGVYNRPSLKKASIEILRFWTERDPTLTESTISVAPGKCNGQPEPVEAIPTAATSPDCIRPSGCLWCIHHRDVDEFDYVWALTCFGLIKEFEVNKRPPSQSDERLAALCALERIRDKLKWFNDSNAKRRGWVEEAHARAEEGSYHPAWRRLIRQFRPL